jgi:lipopolysaccharide heptosyltransferase II
MEKFLIINPFGIGDVLFTTPIIKAIRVTYPYGKIGYWCNERVGSIFQNDPDIDKVFALSRGDLKRHFHNSRIEGIKKLLGLLLAIKKEHYNMAFDFSLDHRYGLIAKLLGIKKRIGYDYRKRGRFLTHKISLEAYNSRHIVEYYLELLKFVNIIPTAKKISLFVLKKNKDKAKEILALAGVQKTDVLVGIAPGGGESWGKDAYLKHWPAERFAHLADLIMDELKAKVVILGDKQEKPIAEIIRNSMKNTPIDLIGNTNLEEFVGIISNLNVLVANDGGPLHTAIALGVKTVSIFGPVDDLVYGPYPKDENQIVIKEDLSCRPCYNNFRLKDCLNNRKCIDGITVAEVFTAVKKLI